MAKEILVVEDEKISFLFVAHHLNALGYQIVDCAITGQEAIDKAETYRPDLVVMDIGLKGGMSGAEAASIIFDRFRIPILFISAYSKEEICRQKCIPDTCDYLAKPFLAEDLQEAIERMFSRKDGIDV